MLRVVRADGRDGITLTYPEIDPRSGELIHLVAVTAEGHHAREVASGLASTLLAAVADPQRWRHGPAALVKHALSRIEPMTVHGGVHVSAAVAVRKGRTVEVAYTGDLQMRLASARESRWIVPGVKHGEEITAVTYTPGPGDVLVTVSLGIIEEFPPQELLSVVLSSAGDSGASTVEKRIAGSSVPQLFCAARFGGHAPPPPEPTIPRTPRRVRWTPAIPLAAAVIAVAAVMVWAPWQGRGVSEPALDGSVPPRSSTGSRQPVAAGESVTVTLPALPGDTLEVDARVDSATRDSVRVAPSAPSGTLQWKARIGGSNFSSSPVLAGMKVYVGSKDHHLYCLLASSGEILWKFRTGGGIGSSPAADERSIYFGSYDSTFYCVDRHAGRAIWKHKVGASIGASPLLFDSMVCCGCKDGLVYAWDVRSGVLRWRFATEAEVWARPTVVGTRLFIGSIDKRFYCLNAETGEARWSIPVDGAVYTTAAEGPDSTIVFGTNSGTVYQLRQRDGATVWSARFDPVYSSPLVTDGLLFFGCKGGDVRCLSLADHREVWRHSTGADVRSSPVPVDDGVLIGSYDGFLYSLSISGRRRWSYDTESRIYATPAVGEGRIYFGDMTGWFYCIGN